MLMVCMFSFFLSLFFYKLYMFSLVVMFVKSARDMKLEVIALLYTLFEGL